MKYLLASLLIFILGLFNFFAPIRGTLHFIFNPVQYGLQQTSANLVQGINFYSNLRNIYMQNMSLLEEKESLISEVQRLKDLEEENKILKQQLEISEYFDSEKGLILAKTLGNFADLTATSVILDKGTSHGVSTGDIVVKGRHFVGIIKETTTQRSVLELVTSPNLLFSVIDMETKTEGLAKGEFGTTVMMERILPGELVNVKDYIVTSGRDGKVLPGYLVGEITSVSEESAEVLRNASISVLVDVNNLGRVFVIPQK